MKRINWLITFALILFIGKSQINAQIVTIPDNTFKAILVNNAAINTNGDSEIQVSEAAAFNDTIDCRNQNIHDLTGIQYFTALTALFCQGNILGSLDVSQNTALVMLSCNNCNLTSLDVSQNTVLEKLYCGFNSLGSLDVSQNIALKELTCYFTGLSSLDVSQNTALTRLNCTNNYINFLDVTLNTALVRLSCHENNLDELDVRQNTGLQLLQCYSNNLDSLDVSQNTALTWLECGSNNLSSLDVSQNTVLRNLRCSSNNLGNLNVTQNTVLEDLNCGSNPINSLDVSQNIVLRQLSCPYTNITALDASQNTALEMLWCNNNPTLNILDMKNLSTYLLLYFDATNNPLLTCIEVDSIAPATLTWTSIDPQTSFSLDCMYSTPIKNINLAEVLSLFPNPTNGLISININKICKNVSVEASNAIGQIIFSKNYATTQHLELELSAARGLYFVKIKTEEGEATIKVVKE